jgi:hypothetical protein
MKYFSTLLTLVIMSSIISGCATQSTQNIEVTRFHLNKPITPQDINIEPAAGIDSTSLEYVSYLNAITKQMNKFGLTAIDGDSAELFATVKIGSEVRQKAPQRSKFSIGVGGGSFGSRTGISGGVNVPVGGSSGSEELVRSLEVRLIRRQENAVSWEGSATKSSDAITDEGSDIAQELSEALFQEFPGDSGKTVIISIDDAVKN